MNIKSFYPFNSIEFRRVSSVHVEIADTNTSYNYPDGSSTIINDLSQLSPVEFEKNVITRSHRFYAFTSPKSMRKHGKTGEPSFWDGRGIYLDSRNYATIDPCSFRFKKVEENEAVPIPRKERVNPITNGRSPGDLIACIPQKPRREGDLPRARWWCVVSEQFLNMWTALFEPDHYMFKKNGGNAFDAKDWMMSGNRLASNSVRKWVLACKDNNVDVDEKEHWNRFFVYRGEPGGSWVHTNAAIYMHFIHNEKLTNDNIPQNKKSPRGDVPVNMKSVDLPPDFYDQCVLFQ